MLSTLEGWQVDQGRGMLWRLSLGLDAMEAMGLDGWGAGGLEHTVERLC